MIKIWKVQQNTSFKEINFSMNAGLFVFVVLLFLGAEAFKVCHDCFDVSCGAKFLNKSLIKVGSNLVLAEWTAHFSEDTNWNYIGYYRYIFTLFQPYIVKSLHCSLDGLNLKTLFVSACLVCSARQLAC